MTSREIIIDLINRQIINGEQAFTLINDLLKSEMMEAWKILDESKKSSKKNNLDWLQVQGTNPYTNPYSTGITWTGGTGTLTGVSVVDTSSANAATAISSELYNNLTASK